MTAFRGAGRAGRGQIAYAASIDVVERLAGVLGVEPAELLRQPLSADNDKVAPNTPMR
jgi:hypothetical protein